VVRRCVRTGTIPITRMPARHTASTVRNGSLAECLSVSAPGMAGVMVDTGDAVDGVVAQAMRAATLADTDGAMPAGPTEAAMQVTTAMADTRVVIPVAADIMAVALSMVAAAITGADSTVAEVPTAEAVTAADTGNPH